MYKRNKLIVRLRQIKKTKIQNIVQCCRGTNRTFIRAFKGPCPTVRRPGNIILLVRLLQLWLTPRVTGVSVNISFYFPLQEKVQLSGEFLLL